MWGEYNTLYTEYIRGSIEDRMGIRLGYPGEELRTICQSYGDTMGRSWGGYKRTFSNHIKTIFRSHVKTMRIIERAYGDHMVRTLTCMHVVVLVTGLQNTPNTL